ncbi:calcitonin gene-related peptide 1-like isoform X2 [Ranitomeya variabilis]|uniref:calcitonin gene-related peptide 1-like isoform X2 n=1 Tax=Ranitomeya variabilis TaxID=490064 RepID=UPI0040574C36
MRAALYRWDLSTTVQLLWRQEVVPTTPGCPTLEDLVVSDPMVPGKDIMVVLKISSLLAVLGLLVCQMCSSQAAPVRSGLESLPDRVTVSDYEARRLLNALVKEFVQMTAEEMEQANDGNRSNVTAQKRACNTATCVTHRLADFLSRSGGMVKSNFVPTNVGSKAFGRRRRSLHV